MLKAILGLTAGFVLICVPAGALDEPPFPGGWQADLSASQYRIGLDSENRHGGRAAGFIEPRVADPEPPANGSLLQTIDALNYRGKRLRFSAFVKTKGLDKRAELWTLVWNSSPDSSDSAVAPAIQQDADWTRHTVEFAVANDAQTIECGLRLVGRGRAWIDDATLEVVGPADDKRLPLENADFEQSKQVYDLALAQGLWELETGKLDDPAAVRATRQISGNEATVTCYDKAGRISSASTTQFRLEQSGRISLITHRHLEITAGLGAGGKAPPGISTSNVYSVNRLHFTEIRGTVEGSRSSPVLYQWKRVDGK